MKIYRIDIPIMATAYVKAETEEEAKQKLLELADGAIEVDDQPEAEVPITGKRFEDPDLPDVSLSPAMTIVGRAELEKLVADGFDEFDEIDESEDA